MNAAQETFGWYGQVWEYKTSLSELVIRYEAPDSKHIIRIIFNGCEEFGGPVSWKNADLSTDWEEDIEGRYRFVDRGGEYYIVCHMVRVFKDDDPYQ